MTARKGASAAVGAAEDLRAAPDGRSRLHHTLGRKPCAWCAGPILRRVFHGGTTWSRVRFCSQKCRAIDRQKNEDFAALLRQKRAAWLKNPDNLARFQAAAIRNLDREKASIARTESALGWCPPAYRDSYRYLTKTKRMLAADARRITEEKMAADARAIATGRRPRRTFQEQLDAVARGAAVSRKPVIRAADHDFTLGGIASALL